MVCEKILAALKGNSKVIEKINSDPVSTNIISRRTFLKTSIGTASGFYFFGFFSIKDEAKIVHHEPAFVIADEVQPPNLYDHIDNKPFINAFNHIVLPTYDCSGQAVHPSVIDFKTEYGIETWGEFRYWMVLTPYPNFNSAFENPSLLVSHDGLNWINPPSIKNPLVSKPLGPSSRNYNSDPELVYDPDQNTLILYWREYSKDTFEKIWAKKISSNYKQSEKILCFEKAWDYKTGLVLSPTVWRKSAKEWYMWTTDGNLTMHLYTSIDGMTWSSGQPCNAPWDTWNGGYIPWHIAAKPNQIEQKIDFIIAGWPKKGTIKDCQLLYATAPMSQLNELIMPLTGPLIGPGAGDQWDNGYIYRSSFVREPGDVPKLRIWYSACSKKKVWQIGYTEGTLDNSLK